MVAEVVHRMPSPSGYKEQKLAAAAKDTSLEVQGEDGSTSTGTFDSDTKSDDDWMTKVTATTSMMTATKQDLEEATKTAGTGSYKGDLAAKYAADGLHGDNLLAYRDLPDLVRCHSKVLKEGAQLKALDFGCGSGRSTRFVRDQLSAEARGVDVCPNMVAEAKNADPDSCYILSPRPSVIPEADASFDLVSSVFVLMELPSISDMKTYFAEAARVLRSGGVMVAVTLRELAYNPDRKYVSCKFLPSVLGAQGHLVSGDRVKCHLIDVDVWIDDYFWTEEDYKAAAESAGLKLLEAHVPLGKEDDGPWLDELSQETAPYRLYVWQKP